MKNEKNSRTEFKIRIRKCLYARRKELKLKQREMAQRLGKSEKTYQRWESTGEGLSDILEVLEVFRKLKFSTLEIADVLGLPPIELDEIKERYQDEAILTSIRESSIYIYLRDNCSSVNDVLLEKLLDVITAERLKRRRNKK